jgi:YVTN family beta-propeller protein
MQNHGKIQRLVALIILNICVLVLVVVLCNFTHAHTASSHSGQQLHELPPHGLSYSIPVANSLHLKTLYYLTKQTSQQNPNIHVGADPEAIVEYEGKIYVLNSGDGTVSVIDGIKNTKIATIPVGAGPRAIDVDPDTNTIYVVNSGDGSVSVIDSQANKVVAKVMFETKPFDAGRIECDKLISPIEQQFYIYSGSECTAKPYPGFGFVSWQENLGGNATQLIKLLPPPSISDSILDFFHMNSDKPEATLDITKFGNFTANFRALPPPIPPEYVATLIGVVATAFVGTWLTPALIGWRKTRTQLKYFKECINDIGIGKNKIEDKIIGYYADGKLSDVHHQLLKDKISEHYEKGSERYGAPIT